MRRFDRYNTIAIERNSYESEEEYNKDMMTLMSILVKNNYDVRYRFEDTSIYCIDFWDNENLELGNAQPVWLTQSEEETVVYDDERTKEESEEDND